MTAMLLLLMALAGTQTALARGSTSTELETAPPVPERSGDWTYTVRPGDSLTGISDRLLGAGRGQKDLVSYNNISTQHPLRPGAALKIPLTWLERSPRPARATSVTGTVFLHPHPATEPQELGVGDRLNVGDEVRTTDGQAIVELADGSILKIERHSRITFDRLTQYGRSGMVDIRLNLERGRVNTDVEPFEHRGSRFEIETPSAVAAVRGTAFSLESGSGGTLLEVREGEVWFGDGEKQKTVHAGYSAIHGSNVAQSLARLKPPREYLRTMTPSAILSGQ
ncbi:FecR domain-containing protein [Halospina denitrificans]|nr:FecR domain-containing protein [Halospina denitrificans]